MLFLKAILLVLLCPLTVLAGGTRFTHITAKEGLPSNTVYHAMQDRRGFLWFCTEAGVSRYDGRRFSNFTTADGLADNEIFKCYQDKKERIWFLSHNGKLSYYLQGRFYNQRNCSWLNNSQHKATLLDIAEDSAGNVWIITAADETLRIRDTAIQNFPVFRTSYADGPLLKTLFKQQGSVKRFRVDSNGMMYSVDLLSQQSVCLGFYATLKGVDRKNLLPIGAEQVPVPSVRGIVIAADGTAALLPATDFGAGATILSCLAEDSLLWIGTAGDGLIRVSPEGIERCLPDKVATGILKDREQSLWVTTLGAGVFVAKSSYGTIDVLSDDPAFSIALTGSAARDGAAAGLGNGCIKVFSPSGAETIRFTRDKYNRILDIVPLPANRLLICSDQDVYEYDAVKKTSVSLGIRNYKSSAWLGATLWLCTPHSIGRLVNREYREVLGSAGFGRFTCVAPISDDAYYLGTTQNLYRISGTSIQTILPDTILKAGIRDLRIVNGALWVATHGNGIFIVSGNTVRKHFNGANSPMAGSFCGKLHDDGRRFVWAATNEGLVLFNRIKETPHYSIHGGLLLASDDVKDVATNDRYAYVATAGGVNKLEIDRVLVFSVPPPVYFTGFRKENQNVTDPGSSVSFDYLKGVVSVSFTAITFLSPNAVQYEYKFADEPQWHHTQNTDLPFLSLKPGSYTLLVRARKYNSDWSAPSAFSMKVRPAFFQTTGFKAGMIALAGGLIYFILAKRIRRSYEREREKSETQKKIVELESTALSCQMNPHFIFNSLNTIQQFILVQEEEHGLRYLQEFATLMRQILENSRKSHISLSEELDFLDRYLQLEQIRHNNKFAYSIATDTTIDPEELRIPPAMFQPLLENAVKHGVAARADGLVTLHITNDSNYLIGRVEDNGVGIHTRSQKEPRHGGRQSSALKILEERLMLTKNKTGCQGYMTITDRGTVSGRGTLVTINIPI